MEDEHIRMDKVACFESLELYGVFDNHCGGDAATFIKENLLNLILHEGKVDFWDRGGGVGVGVGVGVGLGVEKALKNYFVKG